MWIPIILIRRHLPEAYARRGEIARKPKHRNYMNLTCTDCTVPPEWRISECNSSYYLWFGKIRDPKTLEAIIEAAGTLETNRYIRYAAEQELHRMKVI